MAGQPRAQTRSPFPAPSHKAQEAEEVCYEPREAATDTKFSDRLYEPYQLQTIAIAGAKPHPTKLVQSAAMASVRPPLPSYRPLLPKRLIDTGVLSDAQIETIIYAGEAHSEFLAGRYRVDESLDTLTLTKDGDTDAVQFRKMGIPFTPAAQSRRRFDCRRRSCDMGRAQRRRPVVPACEKVGLWPLSAGD